MMSRMASILASRRNAVVVGGIAAAAVCVVFFRHGARSEADDIQEPPAASRVATGEVEAELPSGSRAARGIRPGELFGTADAAPTSPASKVGAAPPPQAVTSASLPAAPDPLAAYTFVGTVTVDGSKYALLEKKGTREGLYVKVGDEMEAGTVEAIDGRSVTIRTSSGTRDLARNDRYSLVPLDKGPGSASELPGTVEVAEASSEVLIEKMGGLGNIPIVGKLFLNSSSSAISAEEVRQLHDDVFEGKMSADDANRRIHSGTPQKVLFGVTAITDSFVTDVYMNLEDH